MEQLGVCPVCKYPIYEGHDTQAMPPPGKAKRGGKSGLLVSEMDPDTPWVIVHLVCAAAYFNWQTHGEMYDAQYDRIKDQVAIERRDELQREAEQRAEQAIMAELDGVRQGRVCMSCRGDIDDLRGLIDDPAT